MTNNSTSKPLSATERLSRVAEQTTAILPVPEREGPKSTHATQRSVSINIRLTPDEHLLFKKAATEKGISVADLLRMAVKKELGLLR